MKLVTSPPPSAAHERCPSSESRLRFVHESPSEPEYLHVAVQVHNPSRRSSHDEAGKIRGASSIASIRPQVIRAAMSQTSQKSHFRWERLSHRNRNCLISMRSMKLSNRFDETFGHVVKSFHGDVHSERRNWFLLSMLVFVDWDSERNFNNIFIFPELAEEICDHSECQHHVPIKFIDWRDEPERLIGQFKRRKLLNSEQPAVDGQPRVSRFVTMIHVSFEVNEWTLNWEVKRLIHRHSNGFA